VVLLAREFGWTPDEMRRLTPRELAVIITELQHQVVIEKYNEQKNHWAFLAAVMTNNFGRIIGMFSKRRQKAVGPDDFMSKDAKKILQRLLKQDEPKQADWNRHVEEAKAKGLAGPW
jgi:hypothetical protein